MKFLLLNPPHPAIGSRIPQEHLPPLSLLAVGGPLLQAGHQVQLLDADLDNLSLPRITFEIECQRPDAILIGHSGSTTAHPIVSRLVPAARAVLPDAWIVYGGVYPTQHWREVMDQLPALDFIVRGEGEATMARLAEALSTDAPLANVPGLVFRADAEPGLRRMLRPDESTGGEVIANPLARPIKDLDAYPIGWELIDHGRYTYYGRGRAVVAQFSRGCPHQCSYCGQHGFWRTWRHRDPVKFAAELARLHREHGVQVVNLADENPTASRTAWKAFLEALIAERVPLTIIGTTRASDIVRDADILHLYKEAGIARFLLGVESTDERTLQAIRKGSTQAVDREAIRLLRAHGIISMAAWVAGFAPETDRDYWRTLRQLLAYDPDQIQALYATPLAGTAFAQQAAHQRVIQPDLRRWDYKHQVLAGAHVPPWRVLLWVKFIEAVCQLRPRSLFRLLCHPDRQLRAGMRWYSGIGRQVWLYEIFQWLFADRRVEQGPSVKEFLRLPDEPSSPVPKARLGRISKTPAARAAMPAAAR